MPILQPGAEVKFDVFHRSPAGLSPEDRKTSLLVLIMVHLLLVLFLQRIPIAIGNGILGMLGMLLRYILTPPPLGCILLFP